MEELKHRILKVMSRYQKEFPDVKVDRDYFPFKLTEEWGECMQAYLMLTDRGRQKDLSKDEIRVQLEEEIADVFGFLILFAENEGIDIEKAMEKKWFRNLE